MNIRLNSKNYLDLAKKVLVTALLLVIYISLTHVVTPGFSASRLNQLKDLGLLDTLNLVSGGGLTHYSIVSLGVMPFIMGQIVVQILQTNISPRFTEWSKQGEYGQKKLNTASHLIGWLFSLFYGFGLITTLSIQSQSQHLAFMRNNSPLAVISTVLLWSACSTLLAWCADKLTKKMIANGVSLIISAGIISTIPATLDSYINAYSGLAFSTLIAIGFVLIFGFIVMIQGSQLRVPISYAGRFSDLRTQDNSSWPIQVNPAGVIPVIFASMFVSLLNILANALLPVLHIKATTLLIDYTSIQGILTYAVLTFAMTYLYSLVQYNPTKIATSLETSNGIVHQENPGPDTAAYFRKVILRLDFLGATYLTGIVVLPMIINPIFNMPGQTALTGTGLLIITMTAGEIFNRIKAEIIQLSYKPFVPEQNEPNLKNGETKDSANFVNELLGH